MKLMKNFNLDLVGLVGYAPTTFRMSSEHSTIELKALGRIL